VALRVSFFQNDASLIQLTSNTAESLPSPVPFDPIALAIYRVASQLTVHPKVPVSRVRHPSEGRSRKGSRAGGRGRGVAIDAVSLHVIVVM
jgi:hypothetical protein